MKKLLLTVAFTMAVVFTYGQCNQLFISEYVEGAGNNKAIEFYNPTANPINLSNYRLVRCSNGNPVGSDSLTLSGTIQPYDVWVIVNGQTISVTGSPACDPNLQLLADQLDGAYPAPTYMNGDDALKLVSISPYAIVDIFGKIGEDPGTAWDNIFPYNSGIGKWLTANHTLQRKASVTQGVIMNPSEFDTFLEYDTLLNETWTGLGSHSCSCATVGINKNNAVRALNIFPNPSNGILNFNASSEIKEIIIVNMIGQTVMNNKPESPLKKTKVDVSALAPGLYLTTVQFENGEKITEKIIIR